MFKRNNASKSGGGQLSCGTWFTVKNFDSSRNSDSSFNFTAALCGEDVFLALAHLISIDWPSRSDVSMDTSSSSACRTKVSVSAGGTVLSSSTFPVPSSSAFPTYFSPPCMLSMFPGSSALYSSSSFIHYSRRREANDCMYSAQYCMHFDVTGFSAL
jgi:hypothetical protein